MLVQTTFLPRLQNDFQSGPIIFGTDENQNDDIIFRTDFPFGLLNSLLLQNAGKFDLNGVYNYVDTNEGKPYYTKGEEGIYYIIWINNRWDIYDFDFNSDAIYFSNEDVKYPWQVINWTATEPSYNPPPIITIL